MQVFLPQDDTMQLMACNSEKSFLTNNCCLKVAMVQCCDAIPYVLDVSRDRVYVIFECIFIAICLWFILCTYIFCLIACTAPTSGSIAAQWLVRMRVLYTMRCFFGGFTQGCIAAQWLRMRVLYTMRILHAEGAIYNIIMRQPVTNESTLCELMGFA